MVSVGSLILSGTLERFQKLKFIFAEYGGIVAALSHGPHLAWIAPLGCANPRLNTYMSGFFSRHSRATSPDNPRTGDIDIPPRPHGNTRSVGRGISPLAR